MKIKRSLSILFTSISLSLSSFATDFSLIEKLINDTKAVTDLPSGTAIAVVKDDKIIYQGYFGYADIANKKKVDVNTSFYIASITKPYFALSMLLKEEQGQLSEKTNLQTLFPTSIFSGFYASKVTVKQLLSHTMGIDNEPLVMVTAYTGLHDEKVRQRLVDKSYPNEKSPLGTFDYSNVGYNILSVWSDKADKKPWQDMLEKTVLTPLQTSHSSAYISDTNNDSWQLAKPYSIFNGKEKPLYLQKQDNTMHAAGGMISSAKDMANFLMVQLNQGRLNGKQVFPSNVIAKSQQQVAEVDSSYGDFKREGYAWGWYIGPYMNETMYHHFGGYAGTHSHLSFMPEKGLGVVILNNEDMLSSKLTAAVAKSIYATLLNKPEAIVEAQAMSTALQKKLSQLPAQIKKRQENMSQRKWQLSLAKSAYQGSYQHPEFGQININHNDQDQLVVSWGQTHSVATAFTKPETMRVELIPNSGEIIAFQLEDKKVTGFTYNKAKFDKRIN